MSATKVILDTNILLLFGQERLDCFAEIEKVVQERFEFLLIGPVLEELERLAKKGSKDGRAAKLGLSLVKERLRRQQATLLERLLLPAKEIPLKTLPVSVDEYADDAILRIAEDGNCIVATLDRGLQGRLLKSKVRVLGLKQRRFTFIE